MKLPHPLSRYAGCAWLPRLIAKIRIFLGGSLPWSYRVAFGSRLGVDGFFMRHFNLSMARFVAIVQGSKDVEEAVAWFLAQERVNQDSIREWNILASNLGRKGKQGRGAGL